MELVGEQRLALDRQRVWEALNDPDVLRRCIPGCDLFEPVAGSTYKVAMTAAVGPVKARFHGKLTLSDIVPQESYALSFEGSGGAAGFGKGHARVALADAAPTGTQLTYTVQAQVGGKLAQVGSRLIDGVARKMADEFFSRFGRALVPSGADASGGAAVGVADASSPSPALSAVQQAAMQPEHSTLAMESAEPMQSLAPMQPTQQMRSVPSQFQPPMDRSSPPASLQRSLDAHPAASAGDAKPAGGSTLVVVCAAVSTLAAAVAVLAASITLYFAR